MIHLHTISLRQSGKTADTFPFNVPIIQTFSELELTSEITFLVGENGSGKSTFLEAVAVAARLPTVGSDSVEADKTLVQVRQLAKHLKLSWSKQTHRGFFLRAEDFFGYAKHQAQIREEMEDELRDVDNAYRGRSKLARGLAKMPYHREISEMQRRYGPGLDAHSHGESFFTFFQSRFVPNGLYLLDEPEAPLSPMRQLSLLTLLKTMIDQNAQFVIATHSPLIMAYPGATILNFDGGQIAPVEWGDLEHVSITRMFLNNPEQFLKELLK